ncbi:MAG TPA: DUF58 domain-containing protein [Nakamurella sp.]
MNQVTEAEIDRSDPIGSDAESSVALAASGPSAADAAAPAPGAARPFGDSWLAAAWGTVTVRGRVAVVVAAGAALLGWATGWREWFGLAAGLAVVLAVAVAMALGRSPVAIDLDLARTRFVVGEPAAARIGVRNVSTRRMLPLRLELDVDGLPAQVRVPSLPGGAAHPVVIPLPTHRRAVIELGPARAVRGDVFGLIRRVVQWPVREQVYVHPRTVRLPDPLPGFTRDLEGEESTIRTASDLSFHTLRDYVPGDDRRFIHWKATARSGRLQVREFLQTHRSLVAVVLAGDPDDYRTVSAAVDAGAESGGTSDEFELAVSCAASLVAELVRRRRDVVVDAAGSTIRAASDQGVLDQFSSVRSVAGSPDLLAMTRQAARRHPRTSLVVLVFGSTVEPARLRAAARLCPPGATVLAVRARVPDSPHPAALAQLAAGAVVTVEDVAQLPLALRGVAA